MVPRLALAAEFFVFNSVRAAATRAAVTVVPSENLCPDFSVTSQTSTLTLLTDCATWPTMLPFLSTVKSFSAMPWLVSAHGALQSHPGSTVPARKVWPTTTGPEVAVHEQRPANESSSARC